MLRSLSRIFVWLLLASASSAQYVGSQSCEPCHADKVKTQSISFHARALKRANEGSPGYWAFGAGSKATTYVSQDDPEWYVERGLTYYASTKSMGPTPGHEGATDMRYRTFDPVASVLRCFRCHSTGPLRLDGARAIQPFEPGVHCESCHGPGGAHAASGGSPGTIFNPKQLGAAQLNDYCGSCHRKAPEAGEENDWTNAWNTRHQPTYLTKAACFRKSAGALTCITCHDPHTSLVETASAYDQRCAACHRAVHHRAAVGSRACVDCHMPQVQVTGRLRFTNHWIGVYAAGTSLVPTIRSRPASSRLPAPATSAAPPVPPADPSSLTPLYEQVLADREKELGPRHSNVARSASDLGGFLKAIGNPAAAEMPLRKALRIDQGNADPAQWPDEEALAALLVPAGQNREAFELLRHCASAPDRPVAARCFAGLAQLDEPNAVSYYRSALQAEEAASGKEHPRVAVLLNDLALALQQQNDNAPAEPLLRRALAIQEKALGLNHTATAATRNNLGSLLQSTGHLAEAEQQERLALRAFEQKLGPESKEVATTCANLADVVWHKGDRATAETLYRRTLAIDEAIYGPEHPEIAGDLMNLGLLLKEARQVTAADSLLRRALAIYEKTLGPGSPQAVAARKELRP